MKDFTDSCVIMNYIIYYISYLTFLYHELHIILQYIILYYMRGTLHLKDSCLSIERYQGSGFLSQTVYHS